MVLTGSPLGLVGSCSSPPTLADIPLLAHWTAVPCGPGAQAAPKGKLRRAGRRRCPRLSGCGPGVPDGRDPRAGWQRGPGQQEDPHHPQALQLAIRNDEELNKLLGRVTIAQGGVLPNIQAVLLPKKTESHKAGGKASK
ncbi:hypothetical protein NDU88_001390 [Pleurodeles waltl]|uniref:Histone H2A C-terminal domain-containing protein n=1 Tax=Pleurodeles waltl TaxID=8319 RepID=A0AAV7LYJ6_PLEWA|nr:hypothetical protein NDU88_001390 [Pleurodeles waltl]